MRIIIPYANDKSDPEVHEVVKLNFQLNGLTPEWIKMSEPNSYALLINELWKAGEPFVLVEHDVVFWRGAIEELEKCDQPLCGYDGNLQCTKIVPFGDVPLDPRTYWHSVDKHLFDELYHNRGITFHDHSVDRAPVINLNRANIIKE